MLRNNNYMIECLLKRYETLEKSPIEKRRYLPHCCTDKGLKGTVVNQTPLQIEAHLKLQQWYLLNWEVT